MGWLIKLALDKKYTFIVMAILIFILGIITIFKMPTDIFPEIDVPVVSVVWSYNGMPANDMEKRIVLVSERAISSTVNDIDHIESQTMNGVAVIKVYFHPGADLASDIAQITASSQTVLKLLPPGITPPAIIQYNASSVPIFQLAISSKILSEQEVFDYAQNFIRIQLATVQGAAVPTPEGGKNRQIMVDIDPAQLHSKGLSAMDIVNAVNTQNLLLPSGTAKIGQRDYLISLNNSPDIADTINNFPIKDINGATILVRDVAQVHDGYSVQTNIVRQNGINGTLLTILKAKGASTLSIISGVKDILPKIKSTVPPELEIEPLFDQSKFVKASINDVVKSGVIAAFLTGMMILIFLGCVRSTFIIVLSIPLAILFSIICLSLCGQTLNTMTLGGLGLSIGVLVDDATVVIENIHRKMHSSPLSESMYNIIFDAAQQIATPSLVSTLSICVVFFPVVFITGAAKSLFIPLALAVVFAMIGSYILSRTVVSVLTKGLIKRDFELNDRRQKSITVKIDRRSGIERRQKIEKFSEFPRRISDIKTPFIKFHENFNEVFEKFRNVYKNDLNWAIHHQKYIIFSFIVFVFGTAVLLPFIGENFFPTVDAGQIRLHVYAPHGSRIEETARRFSEVEDLIKQVIPNKDREIILDKIGLPISGIRLAFSDGATIGTGDGEILIALKEKHSKPTQYYVKQLREELNKQFPDMIFFFQPADIISQILNFGLASPVDIKIKGSKSQENYILANKILSDVQKVPGVVDAHIHQITDMPEIRLNVDRIRASQMGLNQKDIASSLLTSLSSSTQTAPNFWVDPKTGVNYSLAVQTPQYDVNSVDTLENLPISSSIANRLPQQINNLAALQRDTAKGVISHYNIQPTYDIYLNVQDRDLGGVGNDIKKILKSYEKALPRGTFVDLQGQVQSMFSSFSSLGFGLILAVVLVYLLMVVNFQSWIDPFIIMVPTPAVLSGVIWILFATNTTFSVPSLMGTIMAIGVATANSVLVVTFANEQMKNGFCAIDAALSAGFTRLRPVLMTALAMIVGMLPMALGLGEGGEQNAPLARAIIGGLCCSTIATLFLVPTVYSVINKKRKFD